jgi:hypothetical protein
MKMKVTVGQKVTWTSAAGQLVGTIREINMERNGHNELVEFAIIDIPTARYRFGKILPQSAHIAVASFEMLKLKGIAQ